MQRTIIASLGVIAVLSGAFILVPAEKVDPIVVTRAATYKTVALDKPTFNPITETKQTDVSVLDDSGDGFRKSGLRMAVEGRLRWLGVY